MALFAAECAACDAAANLIRAGLELLDYVEAGQFDGGVLPVRSAGWAHRLGCPYGS